MNAGGLLTCQGCKTERKDPRLKPPHDGGITRIHCDTCNQITVHAVNVKPPPEPPTESTPQDSAAS